MTTPEVARLLRVSEWTVKRWRNPNIGGGPPFLRIGKLIRYFPKDVLSFLEGKRAGFSI